MSEHAQRLGFDPVPQHRMQTSASHNIRFHAENLVDPFLDVHKFDQAEQRVVGFKEQLGIALWPCLFSCDGTEQIKLAGTNSMEVACMGPKSADDVVAMRGAPPNG